MAWHLSLWKTRLLRVLVLTELRANPLNISMIGAPAANHDLNHKPPLGACKSQSRCAQANTGYRTNMSGRSRKVGAFPSPRAAKSTYHMRLGAIHLGMRGEYQVALAHVA